MAAYAALLTLSQTAHLNSMQHDQSQFSASERATFRSIHGFMSFLIWFFTEFPEKVNRWEGGIRDVAYRTEDIIEDFMLRHIQSRHGGMAPSRVELEEQLEIVMEKIGLIAGEVTEERPAHLPPSSPSSSRVSSTGNDAPVGLDDDIMALKERLCGQSSNLQVIPIVGMGGIGKSTLTRTLYEDQLIMGHFDFRAWVVVSQDYAPYRFRKVLLDSIRLLDKEQTSRDETDDSEIALKVYQNLIGRRYLIVIDDVWSTKVWDDVRYIFPDNNNGSRVMLTTRQSDVATYADSNSPVHKMQLMNESQCWDLLKLKVFGNGNCPSQFEEVGKRIARRCAGLPLAVVLVAGVLSQGNKTQAFWEDIAKNVNLVRRKIEEVLSLSYTYLPHYLRPCFLFIGGFQEDADIRASRLTRLWVAEGFVQHENGCSKSLEEVADEYLEDLVKRNLVMVASRKVDGKIKSCCFHDMVRELCKRKAQEEKFLHFMDGHDISQGLMNERRISFSCPGIHKIWGPTIRTILCLHIQYFPSPPVLLGSYKLLKVLNALGVTLTEFPSEVLELYHLRYLAIRGYFVIPSAISNLANLQTLTIHIYPKKRYGRNVLNYSLPLEIWRMPQLRHVFFHAPYMLPYPLEGINCLPLQNLQTLVSAKDLVWSEKILQMIPNVKKLRLIHSKEQEFHFHHLKKLDRLEKLEVAWNFGCSWKGQNPSFPWTLKKLTLLGGKFHWKKIIIVGSLPNLEVLKLLDYSCVGETWETADGVFPRLNLLLIDGSELRQWLTQSNPLPALKRLVLHCCHFLKEIPEAVGEISTLELIEVDLLCAKSVVESAKKIKEDQESCGNYALQVRVIR